MLGTPQFAARASRQVRTGRSVVLKGGGDDNDDDDDDDDVVEPVTRAP
jgi:hypothetical protein